MREDLTEEELIKLNQQIERQLIEELDNLENTQEVDEAKSGIILWIGLGFLSIIAIMKILLVIFSYVNLI